MSTVCSENITAETETVCLLVDELDKQQFLSLFSLSVRIIAAVLQVQFHSEWLVVMWPKLRGLAQG